VRCLAQLFADWFAAGCPGKKSRNSLKASTLAGYRFLADQYIIPSLGQIALGKLTQEDVNRFYRQLEAGQQPRAVKGKGRGQKVKPLSLRTVRHASVVLKAASWPTIRLKAHGCRKGRECSTSTRLASTLCGRRRKRASSLPDAPPVTTMPPSTLPCTPA
jgi:hypothetical protein